MWCAQLALPTAPLCIRNGAHCSRRLPLRLGHILRRAGCTTTTLDRRAAAPSATPSPTTPPSPSSGAEAIAAATPPGPAGGSVQVRACDTAAAGQAWEHGYDRRWRHRGGAGPEAELGAPRARVRRAGALYPHPGILFHPSPSHPLLSSLLASDIGDAGAAELGDALRVNHVLSELVCVCQQPLQPTTADSPPLSKRAV